MTKIVVLGDGLLGAELVKQTKWDYVSRKKDALNIDNDYALQSSIIDYDVVVNCIANTETMSKEREGHWNLNYRFPYRLANMCNNLRKKLVHISTDYVYGRCKQMPSSETDVPVSQESWYAHTKLLGDSIVQLISKDYLICRCSHKSHEFTYPVVFTDKYGNFDYVEKIAELIIALIKRDASGIFNIGTELKSMYDLIKDEHPNVKPVPIPDDIDIPHVIDMNLSKMNNFLQTTP